MVLVVWMESGEKLFDFGDVDIFWMQFFQGNKIYFYECFKEMFGFLYVDYFFY